MPSVSSEILIVAALGGIVFHALWIFLSGRYPSAFVLAAVYMLASPFSLAPEIPFAMAIKLARIYVTLLMFVMAIISVRRGGLGTAAKCYLGFATYFAMGVLWSEYPVQGANYKGLFLILTFGGIVMGATLRNTAEFYRAVQMLFFTSMAWAALVGSQIIAHPAGRLRAFTMNPNGIATVSQFEAQICLFIALYSASKFFRVLGYGTLVIQGLILAYTGARGPMAAAILGCCFMLMPMVRKPGHLLGFGTLCAITFMILSMFVKTDSLDRLTSGADTRSDVWSYALNEYSENPIFGAGWVSDSLAVPGDIVSTNMHSIYMTVLAELGTLGIVTFAVLLILILSTAAKTYRFAARNQQHPLGAFCCAVVFSTFVGAAAESGTLAGTTVNALMLAIGIGMVDAVPRLIAQDAQVEPAEEYDEWEYEEYDPSYVFTNN